MKVYAVMTNSNGHGDYGPYGWLSTVRDLFRLREDAQIEVDSLMRPLAAALSESLDREVEMTDVRAFRDEDWTYYTVETMEVR